MAGGQTLQRLQLEDVEETGKELGRGSYGIVVELYVKGLRCAGKKLHDIFSSCSSSDQEIMKKRFLEECLQHSTLRHPNVVQLMGLYLRPGDFVPILVMEYMHSSLKACLESKNVIRIPLKWRILHDVSLGLRFLHEQATPIVHRDLTANNVLLTENLHAKIADLGMARMLNRDMLRQLTQAPGNCDYMPPEALEEDPEYDESLDVFSFGVMIVHVVTGKWPSPLPVKHKNSSGVWVSRSEMERRANHLKNMESESMLKCLAEKCLHEDPTIRPTAKAVSEELKKGLLVCASSSFPLLEKEVAEKRLREVEIQLHKIIQDLHEKPTLNKFELDEVTKQLQIALRGTSSPLHESGSETSLHDSYDPSIRRFIVSYKPPPFVEASSNQMLHVSSTSSCLNPVSLTVCAPVNIAFSGTYVKTVISGLKKSLHVAISEDKLFVVDNKGWNGVHICSISGKIETRSIIASSSKRDFAGMPPEKCWQPRGIAIDGENNVILADTGSQRVVKFSPDGSFLASSGKLLECGLERGEFNRPSSVTLARNGGLYICDSDNHRIQIFDNSLKSCRVFGKYGQGNCEFHHPLDLAFDSKDNVYVVDSSNFCIKVFTKDFGEFIRQIGREGTEDSDFQALSSICIDPSDNVYVTDFKFCSVKIFNSIGQFVMSFGSSKDPRPEFCFKKPRGIAVDSKGRIFVSDSDNGRVLMYQ